MEPRPPDFPPPPPPAPGSPRPFASEPRRAPAGCGRRFALGCGIVAALLGVAGIVFLVKAKDLLAWTMGKLQAEVVKSLPADLGDDERARLDRAFEAAMANIRAGKIEAPALKALQTQLVRAAEKAPRKELTRDDVLDLLSALERVGGLLPAPTPEPAPEAAPGAGAPPPPS